MQVSALLRRAEAQQQRITPATQYTELALQFVEVKRSRRHGKRALSPTGRVSRVYGGVFDRYAPNERGSLGAYCDRPLTREPRRIRVTRRTFDIVTDDESTHIAIRGSRRSAKSETLACWLIKQLVLRVATPISCMVVKRSKARKFAQQKILPTIPRHWLKPKGAGYRNSREEVFFGAVTGATLDFLTGEVADDARGDGVGAAGFDEIQILPVEAVENSFASLSESGKPQTLETCTMLTTFQKTWEENEANPLYRTETLSILENDFLDSWAPDPAFDDVETPAIVKLLALKMDPQRFLREVGKWDPVARLLIPTAISPVGRAWYGFTTEIHSQRFADRSRVLEDHYGAYSGMGEDITRQVLWRRFQVRADYLIGADFNVSPMVAIVWRILRSPVGISDIYWAGLEVVIEDDADAGQLAVALIDTLKLRRDPSTRKLPAVIIPDASGRHQTSRGGRSSLKMLRDAGFRVFAPVKNPHRIDAKNAVNTKFRNTRGDVTAFVDPVGCPRYTLALQRQMTDDRGRPDHDGIHEHYGDAGKYPVAYMQPAAASVDVPDEETVSAVN